jgi:hypothetical protein
MPMTTQLPCSAGAAVMVLLLACAMPARAQTMLVQSSGSFSADAPLTIFSSPGATWSLSFTMDRQPALVDVADAYRENNHTTPQFDNFEYRLNGALLPEASFVFLYSGAQKGGMELVFGGVQPPDSYYGYNSLYFLGDAYYIGNEATPTIVAGNYPTAIYETSGVGIAFEGTFYDNQPATVVTVSAVPLPPSAALMLAGLVALLVLRPGLTVPQRRRSAG